MDHHFLTPLFNPRSIVVFTGPPEQPDAQLPAARAITTQLREQGYAGQVTFLDSKVSGTLGDLAGMRADLAVIALAPDELATALDVAGRIRCRCALIVAAGIDAAQAERLQSIAVKYGIYLMGPNGLGFQRPQQKLNVGALGGMAQAGSLALVSQSGAMTCGILDWAARNAIGFSAVVSLGPNSAVDLAQVLDFLATDPATQSIAVYMEGITHARRFLSALRAAASIKPVVILKGGRRDDGSAAALTHSGAIVGKDDVFDAALARAGAVRVNTFVQLFTAVKCLNSRHKPTGIRLAIVTNGGGPGVLAVDWLLELNLALAQLAPERATALRAQLPPLASVERLIDLSEDAGPAHFAAALEACAADRGVDGVLAIYAPKPGGDPRAVAEAVAAVHPNMGKPLLTCWMGDETVGEARQVISTAGIATFRTPEAAVEGFGNIAAFYRNQQMLQQTPPPLSALAQPDVEGARILIESVLAERRRVLTEMESKALLAAFHIPVTQTMLARSANEAMLIANQLGYPVALKVDSPDIVHKSDVDGVLLNVSSATAVRDGYNAMLATLARTAPEARINGITLQKMSGKRYGREVYIGLVTEQPFGPVISFGAGGTMIELINDRAVELPPLNQFLAGRLVQRVRAAQTLGEWRGHPAADTEAIEQILLRVSEMACELPQLREMDINPLVVDENGALVVDARIVIDHAAPVGTGMGGYEHLAILPYPAQWTQEWPMRGGGHYLMRAVQPDDANMLQEFTRGLSEKSRYYRFVSAIRELPLRMLARYTLIDYDREMALVAVLPGDKMIGVSRYVTNPDGTSCEFALVVDDNYSGQGLGTRLMLAIMEVARQKGLARIEGLVLTRNAGMLRLMQSLDFTIGPYPDDPDFRLCSKAL